jgi:septal ring factor EnvC (AmiA/AmiB activator)
VYAGRSYTQKQVETDLARRFERFKTKEATVEKLGQILAAREAGLAAAQEKLRAMQAAKRQLEVDIENMKARVEMVKVAEATSSAIAFDDSRLSRTREALRDIGARIEVAEKLVSADTAMPDQIALDETDTKNISEEIAKHFGEKPATEDVVKLD